MQERHTGDKPPPDQRKIDFGIYITSILNELVTVGA